MKRKLDIGSLSRDAKAAADPDDDGINPWTQRPYSSRYYEILQKRKQLPVYEFKKDLERKISENQVIIVEGETGSGTTEINA